MHGLTEDNWRGSYYLFTVNALIKPRTEVLQGGRDVEIASTPERATTDRSNHDRDPLRDGIRVDGRQKHQRVRKDTSGRGPVGACGPSIQGRTVFPSS